MGKLLVPLFLLLVVVITGTFFMLKQLPAYLLAEQEYEYNDLTTRGTFFLIEQELLKQPVTSWPQIIDQLALQFAYPLRLLKLTDPIFNQADRDTLNKDRMLYKEIDSAEIYYRRVLDSNFVIAFSFDVSNREEEHRDAQGSYYLLEKQLLTLPIEQWPEKLKVLSQHFGFPIQLQSLSSLNLDVRQIEWLHAGKIISFGAETNDYRFHKLIDNTNQVLTAGPIPVQFNNTVFLLTMGLLAMSLPAIALLFWAYPLWRDIRLLTTLTNALGRGDMQIRSQLPRRSALYDLSEQFNAMTERIQQLINGHRDLTNAVSHELRTPLARMRFGLEMLDKNKSLSQNQRYMSGLYEDIDQLEELIGELLTYARFERNAPMGQQETVILIPWLNKILDREQAYTESKVLQLNTEQCPYQQTLNCCPREMERVLHNLLRNALQFAVQVVCITVMVVDDEINILIDDDGPGIPANDRERVFAPFTRLEDSRNRSTGGYGLGLAIAKRIIDAHHGVITVHDSTLGGACFRIQLSAVKQH
jgi:signal transduction histidine kinase